MNRRSRHVLVLSSVIACLAGTVVATRVVQRSEATAPEIPRLALLAHTHLAQAEHFAPFAVRQLASLPAGARLDHVGWSDAPSRGRDGRLLFACDLYYRLADGRRFHVWNSNYTELRNSPEDPVRNSVPVTLANGVWFVKDLPEHPAGPTIQAAQYGTDGTVISADLPGSRVELLGLVARLIAS